MTLVRLSSVAICVWGCWNRVPLSFRRDLRVGMLEQSPAFDPSESVLDACFNHEGDPEKVLKAKQILTQLKIKNLEQPMGQLSGGQQKRVALANVLNP